MRNCEKKLIRKQQTEWRRGKRELKDYPLPFIDEDGQEYAVKDPEAAEAARRQR